MKEKKLPKSVCDDFQERSEAIGSKGVVVKVGLVGEVQTVEILCILQCRMRC